MFDIDDEYNEWKDSPEADNQMTYYSSSAIACLVILGVIIGIAFLVIFAGSIR